MLFDSKGCASKALVELLEILNVPHDGTMSGILVATQQAWYEKGKLRAEIKERHGDKDLSSFFQRLGMTHEVLTERKGDISCGLLFGATVTAVRKRLALLAREWERGARITQLVLLGSTRALLSDKESPDILLSAGEILLKDSWSPPHTLPRTESEMMELVLDQSVLPWNGLGIITTVVNASSESGGNPTAGDTINEWLRFGPTKTKLLAVSSQPFVGYHDALLRRKLPGWEIETIGYAAPSGLPNTTFLDNLAKWIYELAS